MFKDCFVDVKELGKDNLCLKLFCGCERTWR